MEDQFGVLPKYYETKKKAYWKKYGLIVTSKEEFNEIFNRYLHSTNCEICHNNYKSRRNKQMEHEHLIDNKYGPFRNVVCQSCNQRKKDKKIRFDNTSGYVGICKQIDKNYKQGFRWKFRANINGKVKTIKYSVNKELLIEFATQWKIDNNYNT